MPTLPPPGRVTATDAREGTRRPARAVLVAGIALLALNLRPAVVAVSPLTSTLRADTHLSSAAASLLTTLPLLCFGAFAVLAPGLGRRLGLERALGVAAVVLVAGIALRLAPGTPALFAGSALAGVGIAIENVLLSGLVKRDFPNRTGMMMGLYSVMLSSGAALAAGVTVPLGHALHTGWRSTLALWGILAVAGALAWLPIALRGHTRPQRAAGGGLRRAVWRSRLAWWTAAYMGAQSLVFYSLTAWLPTLLSDHGIGAAQAGAMLSVFNLIGIGAALAVPVLAARLTTQRPLAAFVAGAFGVGLIGLIVAPRAGAWAWMALLGLAQGAGISLGLTLFVLRTRSTAVAAELSGMAQTVGYLIAALGPLTVGILHGATGGWTVPMLELVGVAAALLVAGWAAGADRAVEAPGASPG